MVFYCAVKSSWVISCVKIELQSDVLETISVFIIRVDVMSGMPACCICTLYDILLYFSSLTYICLPIGNRIFLELR
jgi:hypothetical protein